MKELLKIADEITGDIKFITDIGERINISIIQEEKSIVIRISLSDKEYKESSQAPISLEEINIRLVHLLQTRKALESILRLEKITLPEQLGGKQPDMRQALINKLVSIMEDHMENTEFNVTMLCRLLGMNKKLLYRKVKQLTGITPVSLLRRVRMTKAAMLLSDGGFTVSEVMYMVGYSNPSYFSKCFMAEYNITPSRYASGKIMKDPENQYKVSDNSIV